MKWRYFVARGSSDPEVLRDINWIASLFQKEEKIKKVEVCYLAAAEPKFEEKLKEVVERKEKNIVVLPYLLFTGLLMKHIEKEVRQYELDEIKISPYLGKNEAFQYMLIQKTKKLLKEINMYPLTVRVEKKRVVVIGGGKLRDLKLFLC